MLKQGTKVSNWGKQLLINLVANGRNYMQLGIAGCIPVEPRCRCCGLRTLLSAPKPQLTYSFCYGLAILSRPYFYLNFLSPIFCRVEPESRRRICLSVKLSAEMKNSQSRTVVLSSCRLSRAVLKISVEMKNKTVEPRKAVDQRFVFFS